MQGNKGKKENLSGEVTKTDCQRTNLRDVRLGKQVCAPCKQMGSCKTRQTRLQDPLKRNNPLQPDKKKKEKSIPPYLAWGDQHSA
jgi:hypothetical protein